MDAQHLAALLGDGLHEAVRLAEDRSLPRCRPLVAGDLDVVAGFSRLGLGVAHRRDLRRGVGAARDAEIVDEGGVGRSGDLLGDMDALGECHVGELQVRDRQAERRLGDQVADRPQAVDAGPAPLIGDHESPFQPDTLFLVAEALGDGPPPRGDQTALGGDDLGRALGGLVGDGGTAAGRLGGRDLHAREGLDPPLAELAGQLGRDLVILSWRQPGERLEDGDLDPEGSVEAGELEPDGSRPDDDGGSRQIPQRQRLVRRDEGLAVDLDEGQRPRVGATGQDDSPRVDRLLVAAGGRDLDGIRSDEHARPRDHCRHAEGLREPAAGQGPEHVRAPGQHQGAHHAAVVGGLGDPQQQGPHRDLLQPRPGAGDHQRDGCHDGGLDGPGHMALDQLSRVQEGLGGDTPTVQARAAHLVALHQGHLEAELGSAQGAGVAGVAPAKDRYIHSFSHEISLNA